MENDVKTDKNAQISAILYAFYALKAKKIVKTQRDFAAKMDVSEQTLSAAMRGRDGYLTENLVRKVEEFAAENDIDIWSPAGFVVQGDGSNANIGAGAQVNVDITKQLDRLLNMLDERDAQINRLLTLLENEQKKSLCQSSIQ